MKKKILSLLLVLTLCFSIVPVSAIGGDADDPLISLSYLNNTLKPQIIKAVQNKLIKPSSGGADVSAQILMDQTRFKENDVLRAATGAEIIVLAGEVQFTSGGILIDATNGTETAAKTTLDTNTRYIVGEDTTASLTVLSPTAVISCNGKVTLSKSSSPDYNAMADALKSLALLQGTGTGFGNGYDLERQPTRIEAIVMFIRLLGEEEQAMACKASHPFTDVAPWADRYVAYAYQKGYSNGAGGKKFASNRKITAKEYVEFVMRALRYSSTDHTDLSTTMADAKKAGILTAKEYDLLTQETLLRAHVVYVSYYALSSPMADKSGTLADRLISNRIFTKADLNKAQALVKTDRLR